MTDMPRGLAYSGWVPGLPCSLTGVPVGYGKQGDLAFRGLDASERSGEAAWRRRGSGGREAPWVKEKARAERVPQEPLRLAFPVRQAQAPETFCVSCIDACMDRVQNVVMTTSRTMKVRLTVTVEVDPDEWATEFGCERDEVRSDVRDYFMNQISQAHAIEHAGLTVRVA